MGDLRTFGQIPRALSEHQVREIHREWRHGKTQAAIARDIGVSVSTVHNVIRRKSYVNVSRETIKEAS